jgi:PKD repeat protein
MNALQPVGVGFARSRRLSRTVPIAVIVCLLMLAAPTGAHPAATASVSSPPSHAVAATEHTGAPQASPAIIIIRPHPTWINVTSAAPRAAPPETAGGSSAYDPKDNETVYFGGCIAAGACPSNQTWVFADGTWTNETNPFDAPPARDYASMDYDANMKAVLLFGGDGVHGPLGDTWVFSGGTWTNVTFYGPGPIARYGASMAFDPQPEENGSVLFGGYSSVLGYLNDTWVWQGGSGWVLLSPSFAPPEVVYAAMAYDAADGYIVLFGGYTYAFGFSAETWELYSGQWWAVSPKNPPLARYIASMVYVPSLSGVLLFGGFNLDDNLVNDTWTFSNGAWVMDAPATAPPVRDSMALALDGTGVTPILIAGENLSRHFNDTWAYEFAPTALLTTNRSAAEVSESLTFTATLAGGTAPYRATFDFGDGSSAVISGAGPTLSVTHVFAHNGSFVALVNVTDAVGAMSTSNTVTLPVSAGPVISAKAVPPAGDVGIPISFESTVVSPGAPPLMYAWEFGDRTNGTGANTSHAYTATGSYGVSVKATDADHGTATASIEVAVAADPTIAVATNPTSLTTGTPATFYANVTGGTGPYSYSWRFGDGGVSAFPVPQHPFSNAGQFTVEVWVNDSVGGSTHGSLTVTVSSPSSSSSGLSSAPLWFWGAIAALAIVAVLGTVLLLRRRRARTR